MAWTVPTVDEFKTYFFRYFPFNPTGNPVTDIKYVQDQDIQNAYDMAEINFSAGMFDNNGQSTIVFFWLSAFYLAENLKVAAKGIASQANFPITSITVHDVSQQMQPPERFLKSAAMAMYTRNGFGLTYLSLVYPFTIGRMNIAFGNSTYS